jgi:hypothetical protein
MGLPSLIWGAMNVPIVGQMATVRAFNQFTAKKPSGGAYGTRGSQLNNSSSTNQPYSVVYGRCRVGANRVFVHTAGGHNKYLNVVYTWSEGPCSAIHTDGDGEIIYLDDKRISYYETYKGLDLVERAFHAGTGEQTVGTIVNDAVKGNPSWADLYRWVCYSEFRLTYNADAWSQLPTVTCVLNGRLLYDPRDSSLAWSDNGALAWFDFMTNRRYGGRIPFSLIDLDSVISAANTFDANGWHFNGVVYQREAFGDVLKNIEDSFRATHYWSNGKYYLKILSYDTPSTTVSESDIDSLPNRFNIAQGGIPDTPDRVLIHFADPTDNYADKTVLLNMVGIVSTGLEDNPMEIKLLGVADYQLAFDIGAYHLKRARANEGYGPLNLKPRFGALDPSDIVQLTHTFPGFSAKEMRVMSMGRRQAGGVVPVSFIEESADLYTGSGVTVAAHNPYQSTLPDANENPIEPTNLTAETGPDEATANKHDAFVNFQWDNIGPFSYNMRWRKSSAKTWQKHHVDAPYGDVEPPVYVQQTTARTARARGDFYGTADTTYTVEIDGTGTPNTFKWSNDGGGSWEATTVSITALWIALENGLEIKFSHTTGWTSGDKFTVACKGVSSKIEHRLNAIEPGVEIYWAVQSLDRNENRSDWAIPDASLTTWAPATPSMSSYTPQVTPNARAKTLKVNAQDWDGYGDRIKAAMLDDGGVFTDYSSAANNDTANDVYPVAATPAVNDAFYFVSLYPFTKIMPKIGTKGVGVWTIAWEYYNGAAWVAVSNLKDTTVGFCPTAIGEKIVEFSYPMDWASVTVNSITGYMIRARVSAYTSITTRPIITKIRIENITTKDYDVYCSTDAACPVIDDNKVVHNCRSFPVTFPWAPKTNYYVRVRPNGWAEPGTESEIYG